jgi:HlyD family secretion protein
MKKLLAFLALLWGGGAFGLWYLNDARTQAVRYRTVAVKRGDLMATINATGTIEPEEVVDVGAQVAGEIKRFGPDPRDPNKPIGYGSPVEVGTELARLDDSLFKARVDQARATLAKAEAEVEQAEAKLGHAERELERQRKLQARGPGMIAAQEVDAALADRDTSRAALALARSGVAVARANLEEANVNLGYTTIRSPVKGVILDRRVNLGQAVAASLNAPSMFLVAKDLRRLEIWASVNETDIGAIHPGQPVRFTVGAFPDQSFRGKVGQIRLNASMVQSVVTYTVVVEVDNSSGKLLPYLTARLQFEVEHRKGVLLVPNGALRWQPRPQHVAPEAQAEYAELQRLKTADHGAGSGGSRPSGGSGTEGVVWLQWGDFVHPLRVTVGLSDGLMSEVSGKGLNDGTEVVVGVIRQADDEGVYSILPHANKLEKKDREKEKE